MTSSPPLPYLSAWVAAHCAQLSDLLQYLVGPRQDSHISALCRYFSHTHFAQQVSREESFCSPCCLTGRAQTQCCGILRLIVLKKNSVSVTGHKSFSIIWYQRIRTLFIYRIRLFETSGSTTFVQLSLIYKAYFLCKSIILFKLNEINVFFVRDICFFPRESHRLTKMFFFIKIT